MKRVAIVYDIGAAVPLDILVSLDGILEPVIVLPETEHNDGIANLLAGLAPISTVDNIADFSPDGITTFSDFQLETTAKLAAELGLAYHSPGTAYNITRKHRQRTILNERSVGYTATALVTDRRTALEAARTVPLPGVLKPNRGVGGSHTYLIGSQDELLNLIDELLGTESSPNDDGYVLETRLRGGAVDEPWGNFISVESMVCGGVIHHLGVTGKFALDPPCRERGGFVPPVPGSFVESAVLDVTTRALTALDVGDSLCHTELMLTDEGPRVIEVNGRSGGNIYDLFLRGHGVNLIELAARVAVGETPLVESRPPDQVTFHYFGLAPLAARRLVHVDGLAEARAQPEVDGLDLRIERGSPLDWRRGFRDRIYACRGRTRSHTELADFVRRLGQIVELKFE